MRRTGSEKTTPIAAMHARRALEQRVGKRQDIRGTRAQRRARQSSARSGGKINPRGTAHRKPGAQGRQLVKRDQARRNRDRFGASQALELPLLEHAKEFRLRGRRERRDFVQHDGPRAGHFQPAELSLDRSGKRAALVAEQFRFDEFLRKTRAIDFQKRRVAPRAEFVDQVGRDDPCRCRFLR